MALTVWGRATSSNVQVVMWAIGELGLAHERIDVGHSFGGTDTPEYLAMNPNGRVPTIRDGDLALYESQAILRYLAAKYGDAAFWPEDLAVRAELDQWGEWIRSTFQPHFNYQIFWQMVRVGAADRDEAEIARQAESLKPVIKLLDDRIGDGPYMNGAEVCWADMVVGHLLYRYYTLDFAKGETPNLDAYYQRLTARPAYAEHVMVSYEPLRVE
ncbi:glutathione S-transferase family protein [Rhodobacteraceae bacterium NNCM2]|nr:glutathione S-transferase family protein [Coraliihabitans acroporae]